MAQKIFLGNIMGPPGQDGKGGDTTVYIKDKKQKRVDFDSDPQKQINNTNLYIDELTKKVDNINTTFINTNKNGGEHFFLGHTKEETVLIDRIYGPELQKLPMPKNENLARLKDVTNNHPNAWYGDGMGFNEIPPSIITNLKDNSFDISASSNGWGSYFIAIAMSDLLPNAKPGEQYVLNFDIDDQNRLLNQTLIGYGYIKDEYVVSVDYMLYMSVSLCKDSILITLPKKLLDWNNGTVIDLIDLTQIFLIFCVKGKDGTAKIPIHFNNLYITKPISIKTNMPDSITNIAAPNSTVINTTYRKINNQKCEITIPDTTVTTGGYIYLGKVKDFVDLNNHVILGLNIPAEMVYNPGSMEGVLPKENVDLYNGDSSWWSISIMPEASANSPQPDFSHENNYQFTSWPSGGVRREANIINLNNISQNYDNLNLYFKYTKVNYTFELYFENFTCYNADEVLPEKPDVLHPQPINITNKFDITQSWGNKVSNTPAWGPGNVDLSVLAPGAIGLQTYLKYDVSTVCKGLQYPEYYFHAKFEAQLPHLFKYIITYEDNSVEEEDIQCGSYIGHIPRTFILKANPNKKIKTFIIYPVFWKEILPPNGPEAEIANLITWESTYFNPYPDALTHFADKNHKEPNVITNINLINVLGRTLPVFSYQGYHNFIFNQGAGCSKYNKELDWNYLTPYGWTENYTTDNIHVFLELRTHVTSTSVDQFDESIWQNMDLNHIPVGFSNVWEVRSPKEIANQIEGISFYFDSKTSENVLMIYDNHYNTVGSVEQFKKDLKQTQNIFFCTACRPFSWSGEGSYNNSHIKSFSLLLIKDSYIEVSGGFSIYINTTTQQGNSFLLTDYNNHQKGSAISNASSVSYKEGNLEQALDNINLISPDGSKWKISIADNGILSTVKI